MNRPAFRATAFSALSLLASLAPVAAAQEESDDGQVAFNNACRTCHSFKAGDNRLGPTLHGIVGRKAGSIEGFAFSPSMKASGITWDEATSTSSSANPEPGRAAATRCSRSAASPTPASARRSSTI